MTISKVAIPIWAIAPVVLTIETAVSAVLAAAILDGFVRRPQVGGGSITTLLPGFVYASATVMKVCLVAALVSILVGLAWRRYMRGPSKQSSPGLPVWGIASIALAPSTPFVGTLAVLVAQSLLDAQSVTAKHLSQVARSAVFVMLAIIWVGVLAAVTSLIRRERPSMLAILGLVANLALVGLFWHLRFYALGYDQDTWAPR
jgi:hypothetical protein